MPVTNSKPIRPPLLAKIIFVAAFLVGIFIQGATAQSSQLPEGYTLYKSEPLTEAINGIDGSLQILTDSRISPDIHKAMWGVGPVDFALYGNPIVGQFVQNPLSYAYLRIIDASGRVLSEEQLERPLADIDTAFLYDSNFPTFLITVDYSSGCCSSGPATMLVEVKEGRFRHLTNIVGLAKTIHTDWRIVPAGQGGGEEIEVVQSLPDYSVGNALRPVNFVTDYSTFRFDGRQWNEKTQTKKVYWESDSEDWPTPMNFP